HMLKPYKQRVEGTYELMKSMIDIVVTDGDKIAELRKNALNNLKIASTYPLDWEIDTTKTSTLKFKGYEGEMQPSDITGFDRLKYDRTKPFTKDVVYQNYFKPTLEVTIPKAYIIPQGWWQVLDLLKINNVEMRELKNDTTITVESYKIDTFETRKSPFEGHYQHYDTKVASSKQELTFRKGDTYIETQQPSIRYLLESLETQAPDSFIKWNLCNTILQQKE